MKLTRLTLFATSIITLNLLGCSGSKGPMSLSGDRFSGSFLRSLQQNNLITVVDQDLKPLAKAQVLIGTEVNQPFANNFLTTDSSGHLALPAAWTTATPVTIDAPGYIRGTFFGQQPGSHTYQLHRKLSGAQYEVQGTTTGHNVVDFNGFVQFGLTIPAMTRADLFNFDVNNIISQQNDTLTLVGQGIDIPSNVSLPHQRQTYIIPLTIDKPTYRVYFNELGAQRIFAARGQFPFKDIVQQVREKTPFYRMINQFTIMGGTMQDIHLTNAGLNLDIDVNQMTFTGKTSITAPTNIASDETMMAITLFESSNYLIPTDVKTFNAGENFEMATTSAPPLVLAVVKKTADLDHPGQAVSERLSATLVSAKNQTTPHFLPMIDPPSVNTEGDVQLPTLNTIAGVHTLGTYASLSEVQEVSRGGDQVEVDNSYWELYSATWSGSLNLPKWPGNKVMIGKKHVEVNLMGSLNTSQVDLGPAMIKAATHVTHSTLDY